MRVIYNRLFITIFVIFYTDFGSLINFYFENKL